MAKTTIKAFRYTAGTPPGYVCQKCGASGVRLYRPYMTIRIDLLCTLCTEAAEGRAAEGRGHTIGWRVAAVPLEGGGGFHSFGAVPQAGVEWWERLPVK